MANESRGAVNPQIELSVSVRQDGTAESLWAEGSATQVGVEEAERLVRARLPLSSFAADWLNVLDQSAHEFATRFRKIADRFDVEPINAVIVAGNRGSSDAFGWLPNYIGINVQAFADAYGPPDSESADRLGRIAAHEYLHLLTYAHYPDHERYRQTPIDRALWTMFFEGIGDFVSVSARWLPNQNGDDSPAASEALAILEPLLVERLERLVDATETEEPALRENIASGRFDRKWGSLPVALWLHREARACGDEATLRAALRLQRRGVLALAERNVDDRYRHRISNIRQRLEARGPGYAAVRAGCDLHRGN